MSLTTISAPTRTMPRPRAAVAAAARTTLDYYLPDQTASVDAQYTSYLSTLPDAGKAAGIAVGEAAANDIIALRVGDGRTAPTATYGDPALPVVAGLWQVVPPATTAATPWLAFMRPFMLERPSQFRLAPPPDLGSKRYADDLNETKAYGAQNSALRTPEQTATAYFWNANNVNQDAQAFRDVATQHGLDLVEHGPGARNGRARRSGRRNRLLGLQVPLPVLASVYGDPARRHRRQPGERGRPELAALAEHAEPPGVPCRAR
jgi:hypothetical protein